MRRHRSNLRLRIAIGTLVLLATAACKTTPTPPPSSIVDEALPPTVEVPREFKADAVDSGRVDDGWIATFGDPQLEALVDEAIANNLDLRLAASEIEHAAGLARIAGAALRPMIGLGGGAGETWSETEIFAGNSSNASLTMSWELDVWGKLRRGAAAGEASLEASKADFEFARQSIAAATAKTWFLATEAARQLALAEESVEIFAEILEIAKTKEEVGQVSMQDVYLAGADLASAEESVEQANAARETIKRSLEVLVGRYPAAEIATATERLPVPPGTPVGVPADLVSRRPDLLAAEARVRAAFHLSEEARLARLPSFDLSIAAGYTSLTDLIARLGAGLTAPLFAGGALEGQLEVATADQNAAVAAYGKALLIAFQEVEDALANERFFASREDLLEDVVSEYQKAFEMAMDQFEVGSAEVLDTLLIQARVLAAKSALIAIQNQRLATRVDLHLALGGSFDRADSDP